MNYPLISEYIEAIKAAEENFEQLKYLRPELDDEGQPVMSGGNFAVVFKMKDEQTGKLHAVKCFLREQEGRAEAYRMIAEELEYVSSTFLTPIKYLDKELFVDSKNSDETEFPVLLMDWVEGMTLDKYIRQHIDDQYELSLLAYQFSRLAMWLMPQPFAHGDLKPDNILVKDDGTLVLVDYDGMYVPAMKGQKARELGSPDFRHPSRTEEVFDEHIDDFSLASILLSLKAIAIQPSLLEEYGASDRLLFSEKDYRNLSESSALGTLQQLMQDAELASLYSLYILALSQNNLSQVSFRLFNLKRPDKSQYDEEDLSTKAIYEYWENAWTDEYGVVYSADRKRLLRVNNHLTSYSIREGTKIICDESFSYDFGNRFIKSIAIPNTVVCIGYAAFRDCEVLSQLNLPNSLKEIGELAFCGCKALTNINVPMSVSRLGDRAFYGCESLTQINIPENITKIGAEVFGECAISQIIIPKTITRIGFFAFHNCIRLTNIVIPESVEEIDDGVFFGCSSLTHINIPNSIKEIGNQVFAHSGLSDIMIPSSVRRIGNRAFWDCELKNISIPDSVKTIEEGAFYGCTLNQVSIPNSISKIENETFFECFALKEVIMPNSIIEIGKSAFEACSSLEEIKLPDSIEKIGDYAFRFCESMKQIVIPNSVTNIEDEAFANCYSLKYIYLPNSIKQLGDSLFHECDELKYIFIPIGTRDKFELLLPEYKDKLTEIDNKTVATNVDLANSWVDNYGARYSKDWKRLLKGPSVKVVESMIINNKNFSKADLWVSQPTISKTGKTNYWCSFGSFENGALLFLSNQVWKNLSVVNSDTLWEVFSKGNYIIREAHDKETNKWMMDDYNQPIMMICPMREMVHCSWELGTSELYFKELLETSNYSIKQGTEIICNEAFENCVSLKTISIPNSVEHIGAFSFVNCISLERIFVPYRQEKKFAQLLPYFEHMIKSDDSAS